MTTLGETLRRSSWTWATLLVLVLVGVAMVGLFMKMELSPLPCGESIINSDPLGATVSVDGIQRGVTPLLVPKLSADYHEFMFEKPTYATVKRTVKISMREACKGVTVMLSPLCACDLFTVRGWVLDCPPAPAEPECFLAAPVLNGKLEESATSVKIDEPVAVAVMLAQKYPRIRDVSFSYVFALFDSTGKELTRSEPTRVSIRKDDTQEPTLSLLYQFQPDADGSTPGGTYFIKLYIDGREVAFQK